MSLHDYYAARAVEYDRVYQKPERQSDLREIEAWLSTAFEGRRVLEVACGTGYWTQFIARSAAQVIGIDASQETLEIAKSRVPGDNVRLMTGDAYALPSFEWADDERPDAAFAGFWWSHVPKGRQRAFLDGLCAVIAPGARIVLIDNRYVEGSSTPISERDGEGNTYQVRRLEDGSEHRVLKNFPEREELVAAVEGVGEKVEYREWRYFWAVGFEAGRGGWR